VVGVEEEVDVVVLRVMMMEGFGASYYVEAR